MTVVRKMNWEWWQLFGRWTGIDDSCTEDERGMMTVVWKINWEWWQLYGRWHGNDDSCMEDELGMMTVVRKMDWEWWQLCGRWTGNDDSCMEDDLGMTVVRKINWEWWQLYGRWPGNDDSCTEDKLGMMIVVWKMNWESTELSTKKDKEFFKRNVYLCSDAFAFPLWVHVHQLSDIIFSAVDLYRTLSFPYCFSFPIASQNTRYFPA
jgi:hypothetical protein